MPEFAEKPVLFDCAGNTLLGVLHGVDSKKGRLGVLIVVGGPQYRVGSHRQFLYLARRLSSAGFPVFRFDMRGMGDSEGDQVTFEESAPDIAAALNSFMEAAPNLEGVVLWGLCDAASAILMFCIADPRVRGVVLLNPWVRNDATLASARLSNYYGNQITSAVFWRRLLSGKVNIGGALRGFVADLRSKSAGRPRAGSEKQVPGPKSIESEEADFREKMLVGFQHCGFPVLVVLSGADLTAGEFVQLSQSDERWANALSRNNVTVQQLEGADHTFSSGKYRGQVENWTLCWLNQLVTANPESDQGLEKAK